MASRPPAGSQRPDLHGLLFTTGEWARLLPTSWTIFRGPCALVDGISHVRIPPASEFHPYDPLQQLTYAAVVFLLGPFLLLTGAAMLPRLPLSSRGICGCSADARGRAACTSWGWRPLSLHHSAHGPRAPGTFSDQPHEHCAWSTERQFRARRDYRRGRAAFVVVLYVGSVLVFGAHKPQAQVALDALEHPVETDPVPSSALETALRQCGDLPLLLDQWPRRRPKRYRVSSNSPPPGPAPDWRLRWEGWCGSRSASRWMTCAPCRSRSRPPSTLCTGLVRHREMDRVRCWTSWSAVSPYGGAFCAVYLLWAGSVHLWWPAATTVLRGDRPGVGADPQTILAYDFNDEPFLSRMEHHCVCGWRPSWATKW